jgi:hypothetical protein
MVMAALAVLQHGAQSLTALTRDAVISGAENAGGNQHDHPA